MDELLHNLDELRVNILEGLIYRTPDVSFKVMNEVFESDCITAKKLFNSLNDILGILYEMNNTPNL